MDKFLETQYLLRLNHKEMENQNRSITSKLELVIKEVESVIKNFPNNNKKVKDQMTLLVNCIILRRSNSSKLKRKEYFLTYLMRSALP